MCHKEGEGRRGQVALRRPAVAGLWRVGGIKGLRPYYAPNPLCGGASKGALKGRGGEFGNSPRSGGIPHVRENLALLRS